MARKLKSDPILFLATLLLVGLSLIMIYSASAVIAAERYEQPYYFLTKQAMWVVMGMALLWAAMRVDYRHYREPIFIWSALGIVTVALVAVLFGPERNNARRWFAIGGLGIQPSELAKLTAIFFTAALLERRRHRINDVRYGLAPIAGVVSLLVGLILIEPDFGTSASLALIAGVMVFAAGMSYAYLGALALLSIPVGGYLVYMSPYRWERLVSFLDPWADPLGSGFQVIQSFIAVGTGGVAGLGFMRGIQKLFYLPEAHTDFIYAVVAEEFGLIGASLVLACFGVIAWRGLRVALAAPDSFGAFLALGLTTMVAVQAFVNMSVVLGLLPTKGIPLPFVSAGGSSLLVNLAGVGILLNVSQHAATAQHATSEA
jgi:cell division protein FtsW